MHYTTITNVNKTIVLFEYDWREIGYINVWIHEYSLYFQNVAFLDWEFSLYAFYITTAICICCFVKHSSDRIQHCSLHLCRAGEDEAVVYKIQAIISCVLFYVQNSSGPHH